MNHFRTLLFSILILITSPLAACDWCTNNELKAKMQDALDNKNEAESKSLTPPNSNYEPIDDTKTFYEDAVYTFYPKAYIIREQYFPTMCPQAIEAALKEIITVLNQETWFYFTNKHKDFRWGVYWERIVTICRILSNFMLRARVRLEDTSVFEKKSIFETLRLDDDEDESQSVSLVEFFKQNGSCGYYDFYAFYFDYLIKLFNEGIKFKNERKTTEYFFDLEVVVEKLQGSKYQANYETAFARAKRLRERLKAEKRKADGKTKKNSSFAKATLDGDDDLHDLPALIDVGDA